MSDIDDELTVYLPGNLFPSVSLTGKKCDQMCEHCKGSHLRNMADVSDPGDLMYLTDDVISLGMSGMLISGGCDVNGSVPIMGAVDDIRRAVDAGLKVNVHTGFINKADAARLVAAGVDAFSVDIHQDPAIIKNILRLNVPPEAYSEMLDNIMSAGGRPVAHLTAGFGIDDLLRSAELVKSKGLREVVALSLIPTKGTMTEYDLISEDAILDAVSLLIDMGLEVTLGCMRPRVYRGIEKKCIEAGVRRIANPSRGTVSWAISKGMKVIEKTTCCCIRGP
ncbi:MAG: hypothetical protein FWD81_00460 [Methanomassiliicoccaceae archaeon]|nr:hypothetical protein [Methanomassiliicoccaceae archaeon]